MGRKGSSSLLPPSPPSLSSASPPLPLLRIPSPPHPLPIPPHALLSASSSLFLFLSLCLSLSQSLFLSVPPYSKFRHSHSAARPPLEVTDILKDGELLELLLSLEKMPFLFTCAKLSRRHLSRSLTFSWPQKASLTKDACQKSSHHHTTIFGIL